MKRQLTTTQLMKTQLIKTQLMKTQLKKTKQAAYLYRWVGVAIVHPKLAAQDHNCV